MNQFTPTFSSLSSWKTHLFVVLLAQVPNHLMFHYEAYCVQWVPYLGMKTWSEYYDLRESFQNCAVFAFTGLLLRVVLFISLKVGYKLFFVEKSRNAFFRFVVALLLTLIVLDRLTGFLLISEVHVFLTVGLALFPIILFMQLVVCLCT